MFRFLCVAVLAMLAAACATDTKSAYSGSTGKTLIVDKRDWSNYQEYLSHVSSTNPGVFAVVVMGDHTVGSGYSVCPEGHCIADTGINPMMDDCRAKGLTCLVFARSSSIVVNYKLDE